MTHTFYTGVGNRRAPAQGLALCHEVGLQLAQRGLTLRTGDAAFLAGAAEGLQLQEQTPIAMRRDAEVYRPKDDIPEWCFRLAAALVPGQWLGTTENVRRLFARNMMQVLGRDGQTPSKFLLCWSRNQDPRTQDGTRLAVRCADQPETRRALGLSDALVPWMNLKGREVCDALAFAHQHAGVPVLRPGDVLPARLVPGGAAVLVGTLAVLHVDDEWHIIKTSITPSSLIDTRVSPPVFDVEIIALGLTRAVTTDDLRRLAQEHEAHRG